MTTTHASEDRTRTSNDVVVIVGTGAAPIPHARVVIEDGVIAAVEAAGSTAGGTSVLPGRGRWLLPGLWDARHPDHVRDRSGRAPGSATRLGALDIG